MQHHEHLSVLAQLENLIIGSDKTLSLVVGKMLDLTRAVPLEQLQSGFYQ